MKKLGKKGDTPILETVIFIILNLAFIAMMLIFAYRPNINYEQKYAKEIALMIDNARPEMSLAINMEKACQVAKACAAGKKSLNEMVKLNQDEKRVYISLGGKGSYSFQYFSDYDVEREVKHDQPNYLIIKVKEKNE